MKRIAIFCDGTWNSPTISETTNVHHMYEACVQDDGQVAIYLEGVGVGEFSNKIRTFLNKIGGGAFGWGLARNVKKAYAALCRVYEEGDEILIFGFSRGAYTARSLAGMIRKCGLIPKDDLGVYRLAMAWNLYKKAGKKNHPDSYHIWAKRQKLSPDVATSTTDLERRAGQGHLVNIAYLGVWDTVGALGIPEQLLGPIAKLWNWRYRFHDAELSSLVRTARHAVALDERRVFYKPALWDNMDDPDGNNKGRMTANSPWQQLWFVGSHSIVGGSSPSEKLVAFPLEWILEGATGLRLRSDFHIPKEKGDPIFETDELTDPGRIYNIAPSLLAWRDPPQDAGQVHWSVAQRAQTLADIYRPGTIELVLAALLQQEQPVFTDDIRPAVRQA
ncbi:DUF2235 domain-containing protein [Yoonia sp. BS5-3]|uniref:DUF2235 domain-containing protein n=1 Tax=Yoonia phaeophyticola TaxID=3137369 RepID=A0ABZ2V4T6_9RHOB